MGEIIAAGLVAHAPTIMMSKEDRYALNDGKEISLVPGLHRIKDEILDRLKPDTIILFDSHWFTTVEFCVSGQDRRKGLYTSDELPRGMRQIPYDLKGNPELAQLIATEASANGARTNAIDDPYLPIHYPTINIAHFLQGDEEWLSVSCPQTGETDDFLKMGEGIGRAIAQSDRRVVLLASGSMSHRFWPLSQLHLHETSDPVNISRPDAREADYERLDWFYEGNHAAVIDTMPEYLKHVPEARFGHYLMMAGACGGREWKAKGERYSEYENATGTSQVHVWFDTL
jgi:3,4-dihydroxyphenylacetate 2,3-dioxygenase|tara:strand:+ start:29400 stop:30257 length:858 start_codon:yes stop_codon:yes gene_type:complete